MTKQRLDSLQHSLSKNILVLDGAMGTAIQDQNLTAKDFGGEHYEGCNEYLVITRPDVIREIHKNYLLAGADIIETNTFGGTALVLDEYSLGQKAYEINFKAAQLARKLCDEYSTDLKPRFVAGSIGPTTKAISVTGGATFEELYKNYKLQAQALYEGGVDYFLLETCQDMRNVKAALLAINDFQESVSVRLPMAVSLTIEPMGTMLAGQNVEAAAASLEHLDLLYIGLNCATGPEFMTDHIRTLSKIARTRIACVPNAGLPDENGCYLETPEMVATILKRFADNGWINLVGGCCGTHKGHIAALAEMAKQSKPRNVPTTIRSVLSGIDALEITDEIRPVLVGERTNVIGSKKFKELIVAGKYDDASEIARTQVKNGAQIIDVCLANPDRSEMDDMRLFLEQVIRKIKAPLMVDSTDEKVIEMALTYSQGKAIINSINLEDGEERYEKVVPLAIRFGAALVVGTIDEDPTQGMAVTRKRKLEVAKRSYDLLTKKYGIKAQDIYFDPLVFPCATGDQQYVGSAVETIEGIRLIKTEMPLVKTVLGISNVSFGLPNAGREVLNSVFLYHCVQAGLDLAIVNSEKLERYASIPQEEKILAEDLLWNRGDDPIAKFAAHFRTAKVKKPTKEKLPLEERLSQYIIEGTKDGLHEDLAEALKTQKPLAIVNGPLMKGMDEVGRLFNRNELIVAEVLQSAEAMKSAVSYLEPYMEKSESSDRGKVLLATVKGDVHDIGKNLVEIIFSNNGFRVINLGIKVPPEQLISAIREHKPDMVGLSGLLVKSAQQMVTTAEDFSKAGIKVPVLVGGAALSKNFVDKSIAKAYGEGTVVYAKDAMSGLDLAKQIVDPEKFETLKESLEETRSKLGTTDNSTTQTLVVSNSRSSQIQALEGCPKPGDFSRHVIKNTPLDQIWPFINPLMLYGRHLGVKGGVVRQLISGDFASIPESSKKSVEIFEQVEEVKELCRKTDLLSPKAIYQFFPARSKDNSIIIYREAEQKNILAQIDFPRQPQKDGLCLADYVSPVSSNVDDNIAFFIVTAGNKVRETAAQWKDKGQYLKSHILHSLAYETAEGYAEMLHSRLRSIWGFADPLDMIMMQRFQAKYRGKRYSFGYPACPRLADQKTLFNLLKPEDIDVQLTDGFMMDPEASVSAIVFHHPQATYFSVGQGGNQENRIG
ncbi:MAG: methionine synthase [Bacteriovoracia bacterium]